MPSSEHQLPVTARTRPSTFEQCWANVKYLFEEQPAGNEWADAYRMDVDWLMSLYHTRQAEILAMHPVIDAVLAMKHADGLNPVLIGNVMEAIERYEATRA